MRTAQATAPTLASYLTHLFNLPVGCPWPKDVSKLNREYVQGWLNNEGKEKGTFSKTTYATYLGIGKVIAGVALSVAGLIKDNKFLKYAGLALGAIGGLVTLAAKYISSGYDMLSNIHNKVVFKPHRKVKVTPDKLDMEFAPVHIDTPATESLKSETLNGWYLPSPVKTNKTVIFLHGRANNIGHRLKDVQELQQKVPVNVLMVDYRGFGESTLRNGQITHEGLLTDAIAMYDYLTRPVSEGGKGLSPNDISVFGHSLGGALGIELAKHRRVNHLHVQNTFTKIREILGGFSALKLILPDYLIDIASSRDEFDSEKSLREAAAKGNIGSFSVGHGTRDSLIGPEHSERLRDVAREANIGYVHNFILDGAGHSNYARFYEDFHFERFRKLFGVDDIQLPRMEQAA